VDWEKEFMGAWGAVTGLVVRGFRDLRLDGSCPCLEFLRTAGRPEYDEVLFRRVVAAVEMLGFRFRLRLAYQIRKLEPRIAQWGKTPAGLCVFARDRERREVAVLANLALPRRMYVALHEFGHVADGVAAALVGELGPWREAGEILGRAYLELELVANVVAALLAEMHGLELYRYVTAVQVTLWQLLDTAGERPASVDRFAVDYLSRVAGRVGGAGAVALWLLDEAARSEDRAKQGRVRVCRGSRCGVRKTQD